MLRQSYLGEHIRFSSDYDPFLLHHYEFTSRSREEASEEKLRRWKREQALFMQHWLEFFLTGDPWLGPNLSSECVYGALKNTVLVLACC